jgi:hypothetical protein
VKRLAVRLALAGAVALLILICARIAAVPG